MRTRRSYAALALVVIALSSGACGSDEYLPVLEPEQIERALRDEGLEICAAEPGRTITVALSCGEDDDQAVVEILEWPDAAARDAALRRFEVQSRPSVANHGTTWALGLLTVHVEGERDDAVVERVAGALEGLGAS